MSPPRASSSRVLAVVPPADAPPSAQRSQSSVTPTFHALFKDHFSYVWHSLHRLGVRGSDLEDLAHDVFVVVERRLVDFDPSRPIRPWLFGIAHRIAAAHLRGARNRTVQLSNEAVSDASEDGPDAHAALEARRMRELVEEALATLDVDRCTVLVMHDVDGYAMPEIVRELAIPIDTGYSRLRLARRDFKAAVERLRRRGGQ